MSFLDNLNARPPAIPPHEAAISTAVAVLTLSGDFTDLERRIVSIFRDQFPALSKLQDADFAAAVDRAVALVQQPGALQDVRGFVQQYIAPSIVTPEDRIAVYRYAYSLAMANLNVDEGEQSLLDELKAAFPLDQTATDAAEQEAISEFGPLHKALAAVVLGLIIVTADGKVLPEELDALRDSRTLLEPIARLDETQFALVYDLAISVYNRFLLEPDNREAFLYNIVVAQLNTRDLRTQAFHYAASICTADGDIASQEVAVLKDILAALKLNDAIGESIFNQYMGRVKTIDGQPKAG